MCFQLEVGGGGRLFFQTVDLFTATFTALQTLTAKEPSDNWPTSKKKAKLKYPLLARSMFAHCVKSLYFGLRF